MTDLTNFEYDIDYILKHGLYFQATLINFKFITMQ